MLNRLNLSAVVILVPTEVIAYNAALDACAGRWLEAMDLLRDLRQQGADRMGCGSWIRRLPRSC